MNSTILEIKDSGELVILSDGSKWEISSFDAFHTRMWMTFDRVEVGPGKLINLSRGNKSVTARRKI
jgi:hypothetical protein